MTEEEEEARTPREHRELISDAQRDLALKRSAFDVLEYAAKLEEVAGREEVCDEQAEMIGETVEQLREAAAAIWPGDEIPDLDTYVRESGAFDDREG